MNLDAPAVSVLIPTYNYARYLPRAIESALAQTAKPLEIIVADDGSTDETTEVVARYGTAVKYRKFDHGGVYAVRQAMLGGMKGEWFLNLDADNWIEPDFLERALQIVARHAGEESFAFVYPDICRFGDVEDRVERPDFDFATLKRGNYLDMNSLIRTQPARTIGFDAKFNDGQGDYDFFLSLAERGYSGERLPGGLLHYRVHAGSISFEGRAQFRQLEFAEKILAKHAKLFSAGEARILRQNARRGACLRMWQAVEKLHADGADGPALALGWRALRLGRRHTSRESAKLFFRALAAWGWHGIQRLAGRTEPGM